MSKLYVVPTPLGNVNDISFRILEVLKSVDIIACEDTRTTSRLLSHYKIGVKTISYHMHNEEGRSLDILNFLAEGKNVALVSDAGMPGVSYSGSVLIKKAIEQGIDISVLPGPSAFVTALVGFGLDTSRFTFIGFLEKNRTQRKKQLEEVKNNTETLIFYEAPHRLREFMDTLLDILGDRSVALCRELTKMYEEYERDTLSNLILKYKEKEPRGEYVVIVSGKSIEEINEEKMAILESVPIEEHVKSLMDKGLSKMEAVKKAAKERGLKKNDVYMKVTDL